MEQPTRVARSDEPPVEIQAVQPAAANPPVLTLQGDAYTIGRSSGCSMVVPAARVSRVHARIERRETRFALVDAGSVNGTYLNGARLLTASILVNGDQIGLGSAEPVLRFV